MRIIKRSALFTLILYNTLILILVSSVLSAFIYTYFSKSYKENVNAYNAKILAQMKKTVDEYVIKANEQLLIESITSLTQRTSLDGFLSRSDTGSSDMLDIYNILKDTQSKSSIIRSMSVYSYDKHISITTSGIKFLSDPKNSGIVDEDWLARMRHSGLNHLWMRTQINYPPDDQNTKSKVITLIQTYPFLSPELEKAGLFSLSIDEDDLYGMIKSNLPIEPAEYNMLILGSDGTVISGSDKNLLNQCISDYSYVKRIIHSTPSGFFMDRIEGEQTAVNFVSSASTDWIYVVMMPYQSLYQWSKVLGRMVLYVFLGCVLLGFMLMLLFTNRFYSPIRQLVRYAEKILHTPCPNGTEPTGEFNILNQAFENMSLNLKNLESIVDSNKKILKRAFLNSLLLNDGNAPKHDGEYLCGLGMEFPHEYYSVVIVSIQSSSMPSGTLPSDFVEQLIAAVQNSPMPDTVVYGVHSYDGRAVLVCNHRTADESRQLFLCHHILDMFSLRFHVKAMLGAGSILSGLKLVPQSYSCAIEALKYAFMYPDTPVFQYSVLSQRHTDSLRHNFNFELVSQLSAAIKAGNSRDMSAGIDGIMRNLLDYNYAETDMQQIIVFIAASLMKVSYDFGLPGHGAFEEDILILFSRSRDLMQFRAELESSCKKIMHMLVEKKNEKHSELIAKVIEFIKANAHRDISLIIVADTFRVSESLISKVFRQEVGMKFVDYCQYVKLEYARELLVSNKLTVEAVSAKVGYSQPQYFIRKFKEKYGVTPKQYRIEHGYSACRTQ